MASRSAALVSISPRLLATATVLAGALTGLSLAQDVGIGIAFAIALLYAPLVLLNLPLGIALWVGLTFIEALPFLSVGPSAAFAMIALAWVGTLRAPAARTLELLSEQRGRILLVGGLIAWLVVSLLWAPRPGLANEVLSEWLVAALLFLILTTSLSTPHQVRLVAGAFVAGAVVSVSIGLLDDGLSAQGSAIDAAAEPDERLKGGSGDPNFLAAGIVPAVVLAGALFATTPSRMQRIALIGGVLTLVVGFAAAESRGALIAVGVATVVALIWGGRGRLYAAVFVAFVVSVAAGWFAVNPSAWDRITTFDSEGNGRSDLWEIAWRISSDHPIAGVGLGNFPAVSPDYTHKPGTLEFVDLIAEKPKVVHNAFLQLLAETGAIGVALFSAVLLMCVRCAWLAAKRFEAAGDKAMSALARAALVAAIAGWSSSLFLSNATDRRMWVLLALGPVLLAIAKRQAGSRPAPIRRRPVAAVPSQP